MLWPTEPTDTDVTETLQLEPAIQLHDAPKLLIDWSSRWDEFVTSVRPALSRSSAPLAGEAPYSLIPYRGVLVLLTEAFLLFVAIVLQGKLDQLHPYVPPKLTGHEVIYYSGDELPRTEDLGGAQAGNSGRAGGREAHHRTQTIKISRGGSLVPTVVDAPNLKLPASRDAVANLLAVRPNPGPPPSEGLQSARSVLSLPSSVVAPAPTLARDYSRGTLSLGSVIPPAPTVSRDQALAAPALNPNVIAPAPTVSRENALIAPALNSNIVAPAPNVSRDRSRSRPALSPSVISPAPAAVSPEVSRSPVQMNDINVVPPPVSAPEREAIRNPKLSLPAPSVIAPPPSTDASSDLHRLASSSIQDASRTVVPPPPTTAGTGTFMNSVIGKIFGPTEVVPPPPAVINSGTPSGKGTALGTNVVPPPPTVGVGINSGSPRGNSGGVAGGTAVVPPPPSIGGSAASGGRSAGGGSALGSPSVIQPPPSVSGSGTGNASGTPGGPGGTLFSNNVVPPPPSLGGGTGDFGSGRGSRGAGRGGPLDTGSALAPPNGGGSGGNSGVVVSDQPGSKVGMPSGGQGSLSMSPTGGDKPGLGGSGGGDSGIGRGNGPGSGLTGEGVGAGKTGTGPGSDPNAHGGISPIAGPGGAGSGTSGTPAVPGVSVRGGSSSIVNLPSFGSDGGSGAPGVPGRSSAKQGGDFDVTIIATANSGGAFEPYKKLLPAGEKGTGYVYDTPLGTVVMEFVDASSAEHQRAGALSSPQPIRKALPAGLPHARLVIACILDASGNLKNLRVLEPGPPDMTAKVMAAVRGWKFRPAMRGDQPVEVTAILGFGIDTNDRF
jgi:hypothetical protein